MSDALYLALPSEQFTGRIGILQLFNTLYLALPSEQLFTSRIGRLQLFNTLNLALPSEQFIGRIGRLQLFISSSSKLVCLTVFYYVQWL